MKRLEVDAYATVFPGLGAGATVEYLPTNEPRSWAVEVSLVLLCFVLTLNVAWLPPPPPPRQPVPVTVRRRPPPDTPAAPGAATTEEST